MSELLVQQVWVFSGAGKRVFPGGLFLDRSTAEQWIEKHRLTGTLTLYPVNVGNYEWCIANGWFQPRKAHESSPEFIGSFSAAQQEHYHYENGKRETD